MVNLLSSSVLAAIIAGIFMLLNTKINDAKATKRHEEWIAAQQDDIEDAAEERMLLANGLLVILRKMQGDNLNGEYKKAVDELNAFLIKRAHRTVSRK